MLRSVLVIAGLLILCLAPPALTAADVDLLERYPATLDVSPEPRGYEWTCGKEDVWRLKSFNFKVGDTFQVELKAAQVVLGHHESSVLWAVVIPDQPGEVVKASAGQGEHVTSVWLRFHPARLKEFFPPDTVVERGDAAVLALARRLATHKLRNSWHSNGLPMVPARGAGTFDVETREGPRRFFAFDTDKAEVNYGDVKRPLPVPRKLGRDAALAVFDKVWEAFDREYAMFVVKPDVDWAKLRDEFRPRAADAGDNFEVAEVLGEMLVHLKDLHVFVRVDSFDVPGFNRRRPLNANRKSLPLKVGNVTTVSGELSWCVTADRIGFIAIDRLTDPKLPQQFLEVLERMAETRGIIIDLRYNGGGAEPLAQEIAGSFLDRPRVYAQSQYREGPLHGDLGRPKKSLCRPKDPWHYVGPVIVLQGQRTMSSAESFVLMLAQCPQVTTMGDRTAGSSGNPRLLDAGEGIVVNLPRWNPLDAEGKPFDGVGILPKVAIDAADDAFQKGGDPVLDAAVKRLLAGKFAGKVLELRPGARIADDQPKVVEVSPAANAEGIDPVTEIRIRFDRPMNPESYLLNWRPRRKEDFRSTGFRLRGAIRYLPESNEFVIPVILTPSATHRLEVAAERAPRGKPMQRYFESADGVPAAPHAWEFRTGDLRPQENAAAGKGPRGDPKAKAAVVRLADSAQESARIAEAGRSEPLRLLVARVRNRRRALKSLVETVTNRTARTDQPLWFQMLKVEQSARFWWQGKAQFRTDASAYFIPGVPLLVGGDDRQCWSLIGERFVTAAADVPQKNVFIADALRAASDKTDEAVIEELQLEYLGEEQHGDVPCHRLRSWRRREKLETGLVQSDYRDWLFDAKTLLPVVLEEFGSDIPLRLEFTHEKIDEELPTEIFAPPADTDIKPVGVEPLGEGFDNYFLNAMDGSSGKISVRWGKFGKRGMNSSGLN